MGIMAGEGVTSPSTLQQVAASQPIAVASPTGANVNAQQASVGATQPQLAVNLTQPQNFPQNQQALNSIGYSQQQAKAGVGAASRSLHTQYLQNVQNTTQSQQPPSPAMGVQSPPQTGASSMARSSSGSRIVQVSPNASNLRAAAPNASVGQFVGSASLQQQQQQQQQMLASQRSSQGQTIVGTQPRPAQSGQTSHMQAGQLPSSGLMTGSSSMRSVYPTPYMQVRPSMAGQMAMPMSQQYTAMQQLHGRQKAGQVSASHYPTAGTPASPLMGLSSMSGVGSQMTRPPGSVGQQPQPVNRMQPIQNRQPQTPQQSQASLQLAQQQAASQKVPSMGSLGTGLQASSQPPSGASNVQNQAQQAWMQKSLNQAQASYQGQPQQAQPSPLNQQHQQTRIVNQRPAGLPGTPGTGTPMGANTQGFESGNRILGKRSIQDLVAQVDPTRRFDPEVEDMLLDIADDFIESVTTFACKLAKHRKSNILEAKDVLLHLSTNWDLTIPGFNAEEYHTYKRTAMNEAHKQRLALVKKSVASQQPGQDTKATGAGQPANTTAAGSQVPTTN